MTPALVMIPEPKGIRSRSGYLARCMMHVMKEGYFPISKDAYENYIHIDSGVFLTEMFQICPCMYLFIDFGVDEAMSKAIEEAVKKDVRVVCSKINTEESRTPGDILVEVSGLSEISIDDLVGPSQERKIVDARFNYYRRAREEFGSTVSLRKIGKEVGGRSHSTVLNGLKRSMEVKELIDQYNRYYPK